MDNLNFMKMEVVRSENFYKNVVKTCEHFGISIEEFRKVIKDFFMGSKNIPDPIKPFFKLIYYPIMTLEIDQLKNKTYKSFNIDIDLLFENVVIDGELLLIDFRFEKNKLKEMKCIKQEDNGLIYVYDNIFNLKKIIFPDKSEIKIEEEAQIEEKRKARTTRKRSKRTD